jgi:cytochrome P450
MSPVVGMTSRQVQRDVTLNGKFFPAGVIILCGIYATHHHPDNWDRPEEFLPVRPCARPFSFKAIRSLNPKEVTEN